MKTLITKLAILAMGLLIPFTRVYSQTAPQFNLTPIQNIWVDQTDCPLNVTVESGQNYRLELWNITVDTLIQNWEFRDDIIIEYNTLINQNYTDVFQFRLYWTQIEGGLSDKLLNDTLNSKFQCIFGDIYFVEPFSLFNFLYETQIQVVIKNPYIQNIVIYTIQKEKFDQLIFLEKINDTLYTYKTPIIELTDSIWFYAYRGGKPIINSNKYVIRYNGLQSKYDELKRFKENLIKLSDYKKEAKTFDNLLILTDFPAEIPGEYGSGYAHNVAKGINYLLENKDTTINLIYTFNIDTSETIILNVIEDFPNELNINETSKMYIFTINGELVYNTSDVNTIKLLLDPNVHNDGSMVFEKQSFIKEDSNLKLNSGFYVICVVGNSEKRYFKLIID